MIPPTRWSFKAVDGDAAASAEARAELKSGVASLGEGFANVPEEASGVGASRRSNPPAFFQSVRNKDLDGALQQPDRVGTLWV